MRAFVLILAVGLLAGCTADSNDVRNAGRLKSRSDAVQQSFGNSADRRPSQIAAIPDRGYLNTVDRTRQVVRRGATIWYPVVLSEEHALHAVARGEMVIDAGSPNTAALRTAYRA